MATTINVVLPGKTSVRKWKRKNHELDRPSSEEFCGSLKTRVISTICVLAYKRAMPVVYTWTAFRPIARLKRISPNDKLAPATLRQLTLHRERKGGRLANQQSSGRSAKEQGRCSRRATRVIIQPLLKMVSGSVVQSRKGKLARG